MTVSLNSALVAKAGVFIQPSLVERLVQPMSIKAKEAYQTRMSLGIGYS
jgi:hypothetical protein